MRWMGTKPIVIGRLIDGKASEQITILPGQTIPPEWMKVLGEASKSGDLIDVPRDGSPGDGLDGALAESILAKEEGRDQ